MPCKIQGPIVNEVADEFAGEVAICKLNIDENKKNATELGIRSIPTIIIFNNSPTHNIRVYVNQFYRILDEFPRIPSRLFLSQN